MYAIDVKEQWERIKRYNKENPFSEYLTRFNNVMFFISGCVVIIGSTQFKNYEIDSLEMLLCLVLTLISFNFMLMYGRK